MKPSTNQVLSHERLSSSDSSNVQTATVPRGTSAIELTVEMTSCRMTLTADGDPTSTTGLVVQANQNPWFLPIGQGATLKFASTDVTASVVQLAYLS